MVFTISAAARGESDPSATACEVWAQIGGSVSPVRPRRGPSAAAAATRAGLADAHFEDLAGERGRGTSAGGLGQVPGLDLLDQVVIEAGEAVPDGLQAAPQLQDVFVGAGVQFQGGQFVDDAVELDEQPS